MSRAYAGLVATFLLLVAETSAAQGFSVSYIDGNAQARTGSTWAALAVGDTLSADSTVRLPTGATVQLKGGGMDFHLNRPGIYLLRDLMAARKATSSARIGSVIVNALRYLATGPKAPQSAALGARGASQADSDDDEWIDSTSDAFLGAAREHIAAGRYARAIEVLNEAMASAADEDMPQLRYYLAYACTLDGRSSEAWKQITGLDPGPGDAWQPDFVLLKARLLIDSSAYAEAVTLLGPSDRKLSEDAQRAPLYYFLLGIARRGAGDVDGAKRAMARLTAISPESDMGKAAATLAQGW
jgi:hypothetical protein